MNPTGWQAGATDREIRMPQVGGVFTMAGVPIPRRMRSWGSAGATTTAFEPMSKRRRGFP